MVWIAFSPPLLLFIPAAAAAPDLRPKLPPSTEEPNNFLASGMRVGMHTPIRTQFASMLRGSFFLSVITRGMWLGRKGLTWSRGQHRQSQR